MIYIIRNGWKKLVESGFRPDRFQKPVRSGFNGKSGLVVLTGHQS